MGSQSERSDARLNRERLLAAAREVLAERGAAAEMREIAERAGVAVGTLYRHFPTREALVAAIIAETLEEV
ncbi:MAG: helix-turn-helix domain-containing protein, partial [Chloroflexota bacterium]|nr:helix-turn-helix domain-containing protein [Chloroflexota bacterium]